MEITNLTNIIDRSGHPDLKKKNYEAEQQIEAELSRPILRGMTLVQTRPRVITQKRLHNLR